MLLTYKMYSGRNKDVNLHERRAFQHYVRKKCDVIQVEGIDIYTVDTKSNDKKNILSVTSLFRTTIKKKLVEKGSESLLRRH